MWRIQALILFGACVCFASQNPYYVAQSSAGSANGTSCANAYSVMTLNLAGSWGAGSTQIGAGTVVHICGTISTEVIVQGSGSSGNVIKFLWESGAKISLTVGSTIYLSGNSYLLFDGGSPCGPSTSCSSTDTGTGIIENTQNGSALANQTVSVYAFDGMNNSTNVEVKNLVIRDLYVHSSLSDTTASADVETGLFYTNPIGDGWSIHDSTEHDMGTCFQIQGAVTGATINIYNNYCYNMNWGVGLAGSGARTTLIHDNHFGATSNWDTTLDAFHHDGLHLFMPTSATSTSTEVYNNLFDGEWGTCCSTAFIYQETSVPNGFDLYNNVFNQHSGDSFGNGLVTASSNAGEWSNNTFQCANGGAYGLYTDASASGTVNIRNNAFYDCSTFFRLFGASGLPGTVDYNAYMTHSSTSGSEAWLYSSGSSTSTFATWQTDCGCDAHSFFSVSGYLNTNGTPMATFPGLGSGTNPGLNLTSVGYSALDFSSSGGGTMTTQARPASAAWDMGAYPYQAPPTAGAVCAGPCGIFR